MRTHRLGCCGGTELIGINDASFSSPKYVKAYAKNVQLGCGPEGKGFAVITYAYDVGKKGKAGRTKIQGEARIKAFTNYVKRYKLGEITRCPKAAYNPNYGKSVKLISLIWQPHNTNIKKLLIKSKYLKRDAYYGGWTYHQ